mmetsp:Transcript_24316/g.78491  ORF Transcript_24316/g.78491 Transcript_24316/m.78491 type:complete len:245 (+) Transcript_24316:220-954(+)
MHKQHSRLLPVHPEEPCLRARHLQAHLWPANILDLSVDRGANLWQSVANRHRRSCQTPYSGRCRGHRPKAEALWRGQGRDCWIACQRAAHRAARDNRKLRWQRDRVPPDSRARQRWRWRVRCRCHCRRRKGRRRSRCVRHLGTVLQECRSRGHVAEHISELVGNDQRTLGIHLRHPELDRVAPGAHLQARAPRPLAKRAALGERAREALEGVNSTRHVNALPHPPPSAAVVAILHPRSSGQFEH